LRRASQKRPQGVLWWSFYEREAGFNAFLDEELAYTTGINPAEIPALSEKVKAVVQQLQQQRFLLVLDGFERELRAFAGMNAAYQGDKAEDRPDARACISPSAATFLQQIAAPMSSRVLITSRLLPKELAGLDGCQHEPLRGLQPDDAVAFFRQAGVRGTTAEIRAACEPYNYHSLCLRLLCGHVVKHHARPGNIAVAPQYDAVQNPKERVHHILEVSYNALSAELQQLLSKIAAFRSPVDYATVEAIFSQKPANLSHQGLNCHVERSETSRRFFTTLRFVQNDILWFRYQCRAAINRLLRQRQPTGGLPADLRELVERGLLFRDGEKYDLHPIVRKYAYDKLENKQGIHAQIREYFATVPVPEEEQVQSVEDLAPVIEVYYHTICTGQYDEALELFGSRLNKLLYYRFGAYQIRIELLRLLFPQGENNLPHLKNESAQSWTLNELANSYSMSGQPFQALLLFEAGVKIRERQGNNKDLEIALGNFADSARIHVGKLAAAEQNLRRFIQLCDKIEDEFQEAIGHQQLGTLLAYRGAFEESAQELDAALASFSKLGETHEGSMVWAYRALRCLLMGDGDGAKVAAERSRQLADVQKYERNIIRAECLLGASLVTQASQNQPQQNQLLTAAETHLNEALTRCRRINMVDHEPDILLALARWHRLRGTSQAHQFATEALEIANRCEYRLKQADIHNFLALLALEASDPAAAKKHLDIAKERAWCDGEPHWYKPALDEAERLRQQLPGE